MRIVTTADGSPTLMNEELQEHYHSLHGALQESIHVFINSGLEKHSAASLSILEMGFGTGLNAWLTLKNQGDKIIHYTAIEKFPVPVEVAIAYGGFLENTLSFNKLHHAPWDTTVQITEKFKLCKLHRDVLDNIENGPFDLVYFDAFSPGKQPELWTEDVFRNLYKVCNEEAILVTYCSKGDVRRNILAAGWEVEKIPGPPGKREMLRAYKR